MLRADDPPPSATRVSEVPPSFAAWTGRTIDDRYRIESLLGEGGMGAVFLAHHLRLDKKVALKVILPQFAGDGAVAERFAREAMASAKLEHPHIVTALDYGTLPEGGAYLVLQLVRGPSLRAAMEGRGADYRFAIEIGAQIADALVAAHAGGIVHRDLKPENIVLETRPGETKPVVRVLDFGIARLVGTEAAAGAQLTRVGMIIGTPGYMAPEQALGEAVDARADLYALGVILWELSTGQTLFDEPEFTALVTRQLTTTPDALLSRVEVPEGLSDLVARLLAKKDARIASAAEVRDQLRGLAGMPPRASNENLAQAKTMHAEAARFTPQVHAAPTPAPAPSTDPGALAASLKTVPKSARYAALGLTALSLCVISAGVASVFTAPATEPAPKPPSVTEAPVIAAPSAPPSMPPVPTVSTADVDFALVSTGDARSERREAAQRLRDASAPGSLAALVAAFELERDCRDRAALLESIVALHDARVVPFLTRIEATPRRGCGFFRREDCLGCIRDELEAALTTFGVATP
jgi:serine/threonine-protein kinase